MQNYLTQDQLATSNGMNIAAKSSPSALETGYSKTHPSSIVTLESGSDRVTPQHIRDWLVSLQQASPVNPSPMLESAKVREMSAICGRQPESAYILYDPATSSWKTSPVLLAQDTLERFSLTYFKSGMTQDGVIYRLKNWERRISENGYSYWPTPTASAPSYTSQSAKDKYGSGPTLLEVVRNREEWPTPTARDWRSGNASARTMARGGRPLSEMAYHFPTPKATQRGDCLSERERNSPCLESVVKMWPTPRAGSDAMVGGSGHQAMLQGTELETGRGQLNPDWVEWLMGWPRGWTSLDPLPKSRFVEWRMRMRSGVWWTTEPDIPRVTKPTKNRVQRLKALGNGVVPAVMAKAWRILTLQEES